MQSNISAGSFLRHVATLVAALLLGGATAASAEDFHHLEVHHHGRLPEETYRLLSQYGFLPEVPTIGKTEMLLPEYAKHLPALLGYSATTRDGADGYPGLQGMATLPGPAGGYHTYEETMAILRDWEGNYSDLVQMHYIGPTWETEQQYGDKHLWAVKISDNVAADEPEPEVLYMACIHGNEAIAHEVLMGYMQFLLDHYGTDPVVTQLIEGRELWFVPIVNPDGHAFFMQTGGFAGRKNMNRNNIPFKFWWGVDLNRNFGFQWGYDDEGSSSIKWSTAYRGERPWSEPESWFMREFVKRRNFVFSFSYHSFGEVFLWPWTHKRDDTPDEYLYEPIGEELARYNGYRHGNAADGEIYVSNGDTDDWFYGEQNEKNKILSFTVEVATTFFVPDTEISLDVEKNIYPALVMADLADDPAKILDSGYQQRLVEIKQTADLYGSQNSSRFVNVRRHGSLGAYVQPR